MNATQKTYAAAKAAFDTAVALKHEALHPYAELLDSDEGMEQYTELEIQYNDKFQCDVYRDALRKAENDMIDWAIAKVQQSSVYSASKYGETVREVIAHRNDFRIRRQLVDISFRLA